MALTAVLLATLQGPSWAQGPRDANESFDTAVLLVNHTQIPPTFMGLPSNSQDYYWIELSRGQALEAFMIILQNGTKGYDYNDPGKVNFDLELYGPQDRVKAVDWSRTTNQFETVSIVAPTAGKYYFRVYLYNGSGSYNLMVTLYTPTTVIDGGSYNGYVKQSSDHATDWYKVYLKGGDPAQSVSANLSFTASGNLDLNLQDLWSKNMMYFVNVSWGIPSTVERVYGVASYTGFYYLRVYAYYGWSDYTLKVNIGSAPTDNDNDAAHARLLEYNTTWSDHVDQCLDKYDWFQVRAQPQENLSLALKLMNGWDDIFSLFLLDADLNVITEKTNYVFTPSKGTVADFSFWNVVDGGVYYIVVSAKVALAANPEDLSDANAAADYRLVVNMSKHLPKPPNKAPSVRTGHENQAVSMLEDSSYHGNLNDWFQSNDGDQLTFSAKVTDGQLTASADLSGLMTLIPAMDWYGTGHLNITASDPGGLKAYLNVRVDVLKRAHPPVIENYGPARNAKLSEGKAQTFYVNATDKDSSVLFYNWSLDGADQQRRVRDFIYTPAFGSAGPHIVEVKVTDGVNLVTWEWDITVTHTNRGPTIVSVLPKNGTGYEAGKKVRLASVASDPDKDKLTYEWREGLQIIASGAGNTSDINQTFPEGTHTVVLTVSDPSGALTTAEVTFKVRPKGVMGDWMVYAVGVLVAALVAVAVFALSRTRSKVDKRRWDKDVERELREGRRKERKEELGHRKRRRGRKRRR